MLNHHSLFYYEWTDNRSIILSKAKKKIGYEEMIRVEGDRQSWAKCEGGECGK